LIEDFRSKTLESIAAKMLAKADKILVLSEFEKENLVRRWENLKIEILPNAVSTDEFSEARKKSSGKTIIYFGRIHESKGLHEIIEACKILKKKNINFNFRCFGAGPKKDFFTGELQKILGEKFFYGGIAAGEAKRHELSEADIFLLPSRYGEGLPMAMLEAMAAGCVPVAADVASVRTVIKDGENGFLVEPYNAAQTAEKLEILLTGKADCRNLREKARQTIEENFSMTDYIENLEKIYRKILKK
jgi:glycosyltransferase involved in cell wall biosynthesis